MAHDPRLPDDVTGMLDGTTDLLAELSRWAATARADDAAASRARERWLRQQAVEEATLLGVLVDLAERATPVVVYTTSERRHRGIVRAVGVDFAALRSHAGRDVLIAVDAVSTVRPEARGQPPLGDREIGLDLRLVEALAALVADRPRLFIVTRGAKEGLRGDLLAVGQDVLTLRLDGEPRATVYVPVAAVAEVSLV